MPEGDTIHLAARRMNVALEGKEIALADAPNPRSPLFNRAAELQGRTLESAEAFGKHLVAHCSGGLALHSHLGMNGRWWIAADGRLPHGRPWLRLASGDRVCADRLREADTFYARRIPDRLGEGEQARRAAGVREPRLVEEVLPLRREGMARGRSRTAAPPRRSPRRSKRRVGAPLQPRRHLHARRLGVSLVRGLGPGVPHDPLRAHRPALREGAARPLHARVVHAPERAAPGLRVGLLGREPARARVGGVARLQDDARRAARAIASFSRASSRRWRSTSPGG